MNLITKTTAMVALAVIAFGCQNNEAPQDAKASQDLGEINAADRGTPPKPETSISRMGLSDTSKKFIVTGELKFRVKDVVNATYAIEDHTTKAGGYIADTRLRSEVSQTTQTPVSADSLLESTHYTVTNTMTVRVPKQQLDPFLKGVGQVVDFFDYRIIHADNVGLKLLSNALEQKRMKEFVDRGSRNASANSTPDVYNYEESRLDKLTQSDKALIENMQLSEDIQYSTVQLDFYQNSAVINTIIANPQSVKAYEPGFGSQLLHSLQYGWGMIQALLLFLARFWAVFLLIAVAFMAYKWFSKQFAIK